MEKKNDRDLTEIVPELTEILNDLSGILDNAYEFTENAEERDYICFVEDRLHNCLKKVGLVK